MDTKDPNFLIPIGKLRQYNIPLSRAKAYQELKAGRLIVTKVGPRNFVRKADGDDYNSRLPKVGDPGRIALDTARRAVEALGRAVAEGHVDQKVAALAMRDVAINSGVNRVAA